MPTSLPDAAAAKIAQPGKRTDILLIVFWALAMLTFSVFANLGAETGAMDPFELLGTF